MRGDKYDQLDLNILQCVNMSNTAWYPINAYNFYISVKHLKKVT